MHATARLEDYELRQWWDEISQLGPVYGCFANSSKT